MANTKKYPCPTCKTICMANPKNNCADCYLAMQIVAGIREEDEIFSLMHTTQQYSRIASISERITLIQAKVDSGKMTLRVRNA